MHIFFSNMFGYEQPWYKRLMCKLFGHKLSGWKHPHGDNDIVKSKLSRKGGNHRRFTIGKYRLEIQYCERCGEVIKTRERFRYKK